jgi:putative transposase
MKNTYRLVSLSRLCWLLGVTRQAFYKHFWDKQDISTEESLVLQQVRKLRDEHPAMGTRKLYILLQPFLLEHQIKMGRDALFDLLCESNMLVRKRKRTIRTTQSYHRFKKYDNLIKDWHPSKPLQLWVADITYVPRKDGFLYLSLITDACSHLVMGYHIAISMETCHTKKALEMALKSLQGNHDLIHHSDRGVQYCSLEYVKLLKQHNIKISMTQTGDPLENPVAERINGIIKNEYLKFYRLHNEEQALDLLHDVIHKYNQKRPHQSINMLTPYYVHTNNLSINKSWSRKGKTINCKPITGLSNNL